MASQSSTKPDKKPDDAGPKVTIRYLNTNEVVRFTASWQETVAATWDRAYGELGEQRREIDTIETDDGTSLTQYLNHTLAQLRDAGVSPERKFNIRSETGGA